MTLGPSLRKRVALHTPCCPKALLRFSGSWQAENDGEGKWGLPHSGSVTSYKPALQPILSYISRLMQSDRKLGPLKELQVWWPPMMVGL